MALYNEELQICPRCKSQNAKLCEGILISRRRDGLLKSLYYSCNCGYTNKLKVDLTVLGLILFLGLLLIGGGLFFFHISARDPLLLVITFLVIIGLFGIYMFLLRKVLAKFMLW